MASVVDAAGELVAVHRTYLARDGKGKASLDPPRASLGLAAGGAVRLDLFNPALPLVIGEGIETAAYAGRLAGFPAWSAASAGNMGRALLLPPDARRVVIAVDPDEACERFAAMAARRWKAERRSVMLTRPDGRDDFKYVLRAREATRGGR